MTRNGGQKITTEGHFILVDDKKIKVGLLNKGSGNARIFRNDDGCTEIKGVFAVVQWYKRGEPLETIAYNVTAQSVEAAKEEMAEWMPRLQFSEHRESSRLVEIIEHSEKRQPTLTKTVHHVI